MTVNIPFLNGTASTRESGDPSPASMASGIPSLAKTTGSKQLTINGQPFLMRAAELQNSSMTSADYMQGIWPKLVDANINTVLGCVTWEQIEPVEGRFDFAELDRVIQGARQNGVRLVLLWFGSFKNGEDSPTLLRETWLTSRGCRNVHILPRMGEGRLKEISPC